MWQIYTKHTITKRTYEVTRQYDPKGVRLYSLLLKKSGLKNMVKLHWCMVDALVSEADERRDKLR